jgi:hypothetical protein
MTILHTVLKRKDMDILKQVQEILAQQNTQEKENQLEQLDQVLDHSSRLNKTDIIEAIRLLLPAAIKETDTMAKEAFFHAINTAVVKHDINSQIDWDSLATALPSLGKWELEYALNILGISGQEKHKAKINEYTQHNDKEISEWAQEAIEEIDYRTSHDSDA